MLENGSHAPGVERVATLRDIHSNGIYLVYSSTTGVGNTCILLVFETCGTQNFDHTWRTWQREHVAGADA